ncbi:OBAP family protein [Chondromyces apiculatus]|uniref:Putative outer membrane or secreted lipoprotein n=1 Tax=Chondromyces apiculatus DSM 436 TaxID=1192034 RepID=A0A017SVM3_9BACT|nr:OBAP family protein [Chondromyces apiculatus]EYF00645.1 Putative outer membrane or secreted lipoprotein [Chondromyces apiculatus DSM 436]
MRSRGSRRATVVAVLGVFVAGALGAAGCADGKPAPPQVEPRGEDKKAGTKVLEKGAEALQDLSPVRALDYYLDGFHVMKDDTGHHMEAHHYCRNQNEELTQCVIYDGTVATANLIGIEYIISERLFEQLSEDEKPRWHPHNYEILSGQLTMPGVPEIAEKEALAKKLNSYGKTWHVWDTGHVGHPAAHSLPVGLPLLAWSYNRDGEAPPELVAERDKRTGTSTEEKRKNREDLAKDARPQRGIDDLRSAFPKASGAPAGVSGK